MKKKIGIMGGTFDPIHISHLILAEAAYQELELDVVRFLPSGNPPHKRHRDGRGSDEQRVQMVSLAIEGNPHFELSLEDMVKDEYSYTYRLLERFKEQNPDEELYFIIGADSLFDFDKWKKPDRICELCTLVVATRNQTAKEEFEAKLNANVVILSLLYSLPNSFKFFNLSWIIFFTCSTLSIIKPLFSFNIIP